MSHDVAGTSHPFRPRASSASNFQVPGHSDALDANVYVPPSSPPRPPGALPSQGARAGSERNNMHMGGRQGSVDPSSTRLAHPRASALRHSWDGGLLSLPEIATKEGPAGGQAEPLVGARVHDNTAGLEAVFSSKVSGEYTFDFVRSSLSVHSLLHALWYLLRAGPFCKSYCCMF